MKTEEIAKALGATVSETRKFLKAQGVTAEVIQESDIAELKTLMGAGNSIAVQDVQDAPLVLQKETDPDRGALAQQQQSAIDLPPVAQLDLTGVQAKMTELEPMVAAADEMILGYYSELLARRQELIQVFQAAFTQQSQQIANLALMPLESSVQIGALFSQARQVNADRSKSFSDRLQAIVQQYQ